MAESLLDEPGSVPPQAPTSRLETGLGQSFVNALILRTIYMLGLETSGDLANQLKLPPALVDQLMTALKQQNLVEVRGSAAATVPILRYGLTGAGKALAVDACQQCEYIGPVPVPLAAFQAQVRNQGIRSEKISENDLAAALSHLVLPERLIRRLGPAVNSSRGLLIYGPPGNGKTSISEAVGKVFRQPVYVPHAVEVDGQIIRVFDQTLHEEFDDGGGSSNAPSTTLLRKKPDARWVKCRRPVVIVGGELTLDMLDLRYDKTSKFYEAPVQVKALGGVFIIDDFGRQLVQPRDLLNRWIVPLERQVDYLTIHTGKKFDVPFDELVIFSTNIPPQELMDAALMRRVKYKLRVEAPSPRDYVIIFRRVCEQHGLKPDPSVLSYLLDEFYPRTGSECSGYHPKFIVEHAMAVCQYRKVPLQLTRELVDDALENLFISESPAKDRIEPLSALDAALRAGHGSREKSALPA